MLHLLPTVHLLSLLTSAALSVDSEFLTTSLSFGTVLCHGVSYCVAVSSYLLVPVSWDEVMLAFYGGTLVGAMFLEALV